MKGQALEGQWIALCLGCLVRVQQQAFGGEGGRRQGAEGGGGGRGRRQGSANACKHPQKHVPLCLVRCIRRHRSQPLPPSMHAPFCPSSHRQGLQAPPEACPSALGTAHPSPPSSTPATLNACSLLPLLLPARPANTPRSMSLCARYSASIRVCGLSVRRCSVSPSLSQPPRCRGSTAMMAARPRGHTPRICIVARMEGGIR